MKYLFFLVCAVSLSCIQEDLPYESDASIAQEKIEICHNPQSKSHKKECSNDCFVPNIDNYSFCWSLWPSDCERPLTYEWQKQNCHFFD